MSEIVSLGEEGEKTVEVKVFLAGGCREVFVIMDKVGSIDSFGWKAQEQCLVFCVRTQCKT